ncbi:MAG: DUF1549 domain-containing protein [Myxococcota bacterium]
MIPLTLLLGCPAPAPDAAPPTRTEMAPARLLRRLSLDLRGRPPTLDELHRGLDDPSVADELVEDWLHDPGFGDRVAALWSEITLTRTEDFPFSAFDLHLPDDVALDRALGDEAPRLWAHVAEEDLPYTEIVTADYTMADETLAAAFGLDRDRGPGWQPARYPDGRPAAGVLAGNGLWWRYGSTSSNANRKRANQTSRMLLCNDYLVRPISFDRNVDLLDEGAVDDALRSDPTCVSCHVTLDPLASYFFGFWAYSEDSAIEASVYHPDRERLWTDYTGVAPGYYGATGTGSLAELGRRIASDERFVGCAVEQAYTLLLRRPPTLADADRLTAHREDFLQGGLTIRALLRSVVADPDYRAGNSEVPGTVPVKLMTPDLLADQVEALTGFRWTFDGRDLLGTDAIGVRTLAGGADGTAVTSAATAPNATLVVVQQRLAEAAVAWLFSQDPGALLTRVDVDDAEPADAAAQFVDLHLLLLGQDVPADGEAVAADLALWQELLAADGDPRAAWAGTVYALMRDPDFVLY